MAMFILFITRIVYVYERMYTITIQKVYITLKSIVLTIAETQFVLFVFAKSYNTYSDEI